MEYADWAPTMRAIREEFGYKETDDRRAAEELARLVTRAVRFRELGVEVRNRTNVTVVGAGPGLLKVKPGLFVDQVVVACDGATERLREIGVVPHLTVTDLDGDAESLVWAAKQGSRMVVHAHGDNRDALEMVKRFGPLVHGTHQVQPTPDLAPLVNIGGFTDGDRAVMLCEHLGALRVRLVAFEFDEGPSKYSHRWDPKTKPQKLAWARRIVEGVHARGKTYVEMWVP